VEPICQRANVLRATFSGIVREFRNRYLITYRPQGVNAPGWHTIDLQLKNGRAAIKARRGYAK
jgi:hypothetical protein